jgi:alkylation response protein AidB-like acyl-CoA dehydrogenase
VDESVQAGVDMTDSRFWEVMGRAATWAAASRILNYATVQAAADESPEYSNLAAVYRVALGQMEMGSAQAFVDILGPNALLDTSRADYQLISGIVSTIGGGSIEMALNSIARSQLDLPRD